MRTPTRREDVDYGNRGVRRCSQTVQERLGVRVEVNPSKVYRLSARIGDGVAVATQHLPEHRESLLTIDQEPDLSVGFIEGREDVEGLSEEMLVSRTSPPHHRASNGISLENRIKKLAGLLFGPNELPLQLGNRKDAPFKLSSKSPKRETAGCDHVALLNPPCSFVQPKQPNELGQRRAGTLLASGKPSHARPPHRG